VARPRQSNIGSDESTVWIVKRRPTSGGWQVLLSYTMKWAFQDEDRGARGTIAGSGQLLEPLLPPVTSRAATALKEHE
jgi:hypothetical protein